MIARMQDCPRCGAPLVAARSRRIGLCSGCVAQVDSSPPTEAGHVEHEQDCPGAEVVEHETARRTLLVCRGCRATAYRPRVTRWSE